MNFLDNQLSSEMGSFEGKRKGLKFMRWEARCVGDTNLLPPWVTRCILPPYISSYNIIFRDLRLRNLHLLLPLSWQSPLIFFSFSLSNETTFNNHSVCINQEQIIKTHYSTKRILKHIITQSLYAIS